MPYRKNDEETASDDVNPASGNSNHAGKYGRRQIQSNWSRYEPENLRNDSVDERKTDDFDALVNTPSDCNYFQFRSEKNWENEASYSTFSGHKFFNLDLEVLSNGLACVPFYERVELDKSILPQSDIERCNRKAQESLIKYKAIQENFMKKLQEDYKLPGLIEKIDGIKSESKKNAPQVIHTNIVDDIPDEMETLLELLNSQDLKFINDETDSGENVKQSKTDEEESLEEWLDSVLGD